MTDSIKYIALSQGKYAIVDADRYDSLMKYHWQAEKKKRSWYAFTTIKGPTRTYKLYMHRLVAFTPANMVTHHKNRNPLDNRFANLLNMLRHDHKILHINNPIRVRTQGDFCGPAEI